MMFEYMEEIGRVLPVIDMDETGPPPSDDDYREAERLEAAVAARDPRVLLVEDGHGNVRVHWLE